MRHAFVIAASLGAFACSREAPIPEGSFDAAADGRTTVECYTAFIQRTIGNFQYDLRLPPEVVEAHQTAGGPKSGWRLQPYFDRAKRAVGGEARAVEIAQAYMFPIQTEIRAAPDLEGRREAFQRLVVDKTEACHRLMDAWGAPRL